MERPTEQGYFTAHGSAGQPGWGTLRGSQMLAGWPTSWPMAEPAIYDAPVSSEDESTSWTKDMRQRLDELLEEYRRTLLAALDGLSEQEARVSLVPSKTTLLGLVKHVTYVEGVWFDQALTGRSYAEIGIATTPDRSFTLTRADTVASVSAAYEARAEASRRAARQLHLSVVVDGRGERPVWALYLQVLRELAQHAGHADILREQVLDQRTT